MPSNIDVKITADVVSVQANLGIAQQQLRETQKAFRDLAAQAAQSGMADQFRPQLLQASEAMLQAQSRVQGLKTDLKEMQGFSFKGLAESAGVLSDALAQVGIAVGIGAIIGFGKEALNTAADVEHESEVLGLTSTALRDFQESARLAGVETATVDSAIRKFNDSQGKAQQGVKSQADAFRELGVDAMLPAEQALPLLANALLHITDVAEQSRLEVVLFGRSGEELRPALESWAQGTEALTRKMQDLGLAMDPTVTEGAERTRQSLTQASDVLSNQAAPAALAFEHALLGLAYAFDLVDQKTLQAVRDAGLFHGTVETAADAIAAMAQAHAGMIAKADLAAAAEDHVGTRIDAVKAHITDLKTAIDSMKGGWLTPDDQKKLDEYNAALKQANIELLKLGKSQAGPNTSGFSNMGAEQIKAAETTIATIKADEQQDNIERLSRARAVWIDLLLGAKLNAAQIMEVKQKIAQTDIELNNAEVKAAKDAAKQKQQIADDELAEYITDQKDRLTSGIDELNQEFAQHRINAQQKHDQEVWLTRQIEAQILKRFDDEHAGLIKGTADYAKAMKDRAALVAGFDRQVGQMDNQLVTQEQQKWTTLSNSIKSTFSNAINGMLFQGTTFAKGMQQIATGVLQAFVNMGVGMVEDWAETQIKNLVLGQSTQKEQLASGIATASALAGANGVASMALAPYPLDLTAPAFGASMMAAASSFAFVGMFETGAWEVPKTGSAIVHQGEMIIPRNPAQAIRDGDIGGKGGGDIHSPVSVTVHNYGGGPVTPEFSRKVAQAVEREVRLNNRNLQKIMRGQR